MLWGTGGGHGQALCFEEEQQNGPASAGPVCCHSQHFAQIPRPTGPRTFQPLEVVEARTNGGFVRNAG